MMTFDSLSLLRWLRELEQQITEAPRHLEALRTIGDGHDLHDAVRVTIDAKRHVGAMAVTTGHLKAEIVPADGLGATLGSLSELVLRAVRIVVLEELGTLRAVVTSRTLRGRSRELSWGRFWGIEDLTISVCADLDEFTDLWRGYLRMGAIDRGAYRVGLRAAHTSMRRLGTTSEFARFLRKGRTRTDWPALQRPCGHMYDALAIRIDVDPDLPVLAFAPLRSKARGGADVTICMTEVRSSTVDGAGPPALLDTFEAAIQDVTRLTLALTSATAKLAYDDGARVRGELERALSRSQALTDGLPDSAERTEAQRQLCETQTIITRVLMSAPAPTSLAIAAAEAGDPTVWEREKLAWTAGRLAIETSSRLPMPRRGRPETRPDSPRAIRQAPGEAGDAPAAAARALNPSTASAPEKAGRQ